MPGRHRESYGVVTAHVLDEHALAVPTETDAARLRTPSIGVW